MRSVDRVFKFIDLPSEEPLPGKSGGKGGPDLIIDNPHARECWPNRGQMDVKGLTVKYTEAGRAVLSDISFSVDGGQSVSLSDGQSMCVWERFLMKLVRVTHVVTFGIGF